MTTIDTRPEAGGHPRRAHPVGTCTDRCRQLGDHHRPQADRAPVHRVQPGRRARRGGGGRAARARPHRPRSATLSSGSIDQLFSLFRVGLIVLAVLPLALGLCVAVVPLQLGARALAFPRMAMLGFWSWLAGGILMIIAYAATAAPAVATCTWSTSTSTGLGLCAIGLVLAATSRRHVGAHDPGARHAHQPHAAVRLVGARRRRRDGDHDERALRHPRARRRRPPLRPAGVRRQQGHQPVAGLRLHHAGDLRVRRARCSASCSMSSPRSPTGASRCAASPSSASAVAGSAVLGAVTQLRHDVTWHGEQARRLHPGRRCRTRCSTSCRSSVCWWCCSSVR